MSTTRSREIRFFMAGALGLLFGYALWRGIVTLPLEWVLPAALRVAEAFKHYDNNWPRNLAEASGIVLMSMPNTLLVSLAAVCVIRFTQQARTVLYASLVWPLLVYILYWFRASKAAAGIGIMGMNPRAAIWFAQVEFAPRAIFIFCTYALYVLLVFLFSLALSKYFAAKS